jgi:quercetin dioxygenase-like cupin family protein
MENFYIGKYKEDSKKKDGWFLGYSMESGLRKTDKVQFKYWKLKKGENKENKSLTHKLAEYSIILKGKIDGEIDGQRIELEAGDYIIVGPGIPHKYPINVYKDVEAFTFRAPSISD